MNHYSTIAKESGIREKQIAAVDEMLLAGNTVPFIARYRKERTDSLDEEQIRTIQSSLERLRALESRRITIINSIEEQGKMTKDLLFKIENASTLTALEDLYQSYKPKKKTRASMAREKGLEGLAEIILKQPANVDPITAARSYLNDQVKSTDEAFAGAMDIIAEMISDHAEVRAGVREKASKWAVLHCEKKAKAEDSRKVYEIYYEYNAKVDKLQAYQVLAINRGEDENVLRVWLEFSEREWRSVAETYFRGRSSSPFFPYLQQAMDDSAERLLLPAIERDIRRNQKEAAELQAIKVFSDNLKALLLQPPIHGKVVLGIDPGYRTGCKVAVVAETGKVLGTITIYPHPPQNKKEESREVLEKLIKHFNVTLISIGNGTASRETEQLVAEITSVHKDVLYIIANEAGASVYSASPLAKMELPDLDVSMRGAVSIARRVQDPLAELVKIDPQSIGVGMYQHDVNQKALATTLNGVVEDAVNAVGVDVNTASPALLSYVSGIGPKLAERIVLYRDKLGAFSDRRTILQVEGMGPKAFEQSAGFLRIYGGKKTLDSTGIHPESYPAAEGILVRTGINLLEISISDRMQAIEKLLRDRTIKELSVELSCGIPTLNDIFDQLKRPGRDIRQDMPKPFLKSTVVAMEDLAEGMQLKGTVRNVVDFGVFVDVGVKQDGLIHRSQISPQVVLKAGMLVDVEILKVEIERGRISLRYISPGKA